MSEFSDTEYLAKPSVVNAIKRKKKEIWRENKWARGGKQRIPASNKEIRLWYVMD